MENLLSEQTAIKQVMAPVDLNTAAVTGARIKLEKGHRIAAVLSMGTSTAAVVEVTLRQHNAASAGTSKDLVGNKPHFTKSGAETSFTKVEQVTALALKDVSTQFASNGGILVVEASAEELDINNGFAWFSIDIADTTAAKLGSAVYHLHDMKFQPAFSEVV